MALTVDLGLGGRFRHLLITASDVVSVWALAEWYRTRVRDIAFDQNDGAFVDDDGCTRAVSVDLPEGALGCTFDGTGHVLVADDGAGYYQPGDATARTLSCAAGDIDIIFLLKTSTNDATERTIVQKHDGTIGYLVNLVSGAIRFKLDVTAGGVFNFTRGSVSDNALHLIHCTYDSVAGEARVLIDGAQSGATVSVAATDPELSVADFYIGKTPTTSGLIGTLSYVAISRNGNAALSPILQATRAWTDVSADVHGDAVEIINGLTGTSLRDRHAGIGSVSFTLNNLPSVAGTLTPGRYTIGHANCRTNFNLGVPVRVRDGALVRFRGWLRRADPEVGLHRGAWRVEAEAVDWMSVAAKTDLTAIPVLVNARSDEAYAAVVDEADQPPFAVMRTAGSTTFPFCFDKVSGTALSELSRIVASEAGYAYIRPDSTTGGVLTFEPRGTRQLDVTPDATFTETMTTMSVEITDEALINIVRATVTPRDATGAATTVLYQQAQRQRIASGDTLVVEDSYQDPAQSRSSIGGTDFQTFTAGTDYTFTANENGTGVVLTSSLTEHHIFGGSGFHLEFKNTHATSAGWVAYQVRGRPLYTDTPVTETVQDRDSVRLHRAHPYEEAYAYLDDAETARGLSELVISLFSAASRVPEAVQFRPVTGSALDTTLRARSVGDLVALVESMTGIAATQKFWIQSERLLYLPADRLEVSYGLFPSFAENDDEFGAWDETNWDECVWGV